MFLTVMHALDQLCAEVPASLRALGLALFDPSRRVFVPFLGLALLWAVGVGLSRGASVRGTLRSFLSPSVWLHPSALHDYKLIAARALLALLTRGFALVSQLALALWVASTLRHHLGLHDLGVSRFWAGAGFTLLAFLLEDWSRYYVHRLMHAMPTLWAFHKVHHAAEVLTPFTLYRTHPVEAAINNLRGVVTLGLFTGLWSWLVGPRFEAWQIVGVDALGFLWSLSGANLRHSHVWLSFGRLERLFLSPASHQVHHSVDPAHHNRNYGSVFGLWDWASGSLYMTRSTPESLQYGLGPDDPMTRPTVVGSLVGPFAEAGRHLARTFAPRRKALAAAVMGSLLMLGGGCSSSEPKVDRPAVLRAFSQCTAEAVQRFTPTTTRLREATMAWAAAPTSADALTAARTAWGQSMDQWQVAEMLRFGPAGGVLTLGGQGMRDHIYAWPDVNRCLIEQRLVEGRYEQPMVESLSISTRGLGALEYLLYYEGTDNACPASDPINANGTWAALSAADRTQRRARAAAALANDLVTRATALQTAWEPTGFPNELTRAGTGSTLFTTQQEALGTVAEATFYLDTDVKDLRLGVPLGITPSCMGAACASRVESTWADRGKRNLQQNIVGLRVLLEGCATGGNLGFDDLLTAAGAGSQVATLRADINAAEQAVTAIPGESLSQAIVNNRDAVVRAHAAIKELTDFLKMEFSMILQIRSMRVEGDND